MTKFWPMGCKLKCPVSLSRKLCLRESWCVSVVSPSPHSSFLRHGGKCDSWSQSETTSSILGNGGAMS